MKKYLLGFCLLATGCSAMGGWMQAKPTQVVVAEGCKAAMLDDNRNNTLVNNVVPYPEVKAALNTAHAAIQVALQQCIDRATQAAGQ